MVNHSILQTHLSQNLWTQQCTFTHLPQLTAIWSFWSPSFEVVIISWYPLRQDFFVVFIIENLTLGQHFFCLLLWESRSPGYLLTFSVCRRPGALWKLKFCKVNPNVWPQSEAVEGNCLASFQLNALGKTALQIILGRMNVSTDKYYVVFCSSFVAHNIPFCRLSYAEVCVPVCWGTGSVYFYIENFNNSVNYSL